MNVVPSILVSVSVRRGNFLIFNLVRLERLHINRSAWHVCVCVYDIFIAQYLRSGIPFRTSLDLCKGWNWKFVFRRGSLVLMFIKKMCAWHTFISLFFGNFLCYLLYTKHCISLMYHWTSIAKYVKHVLPQHSWWIRHLEAGDYSILELDIWQLNLIAIFFMR